MFRPVHRIGRHPLRLIGLRSFRAYPSDRPFRVVALLAVLTVLNAFDLAFTQSQMIRGNFAEANALAAVVVHGLIGPAGPVAYKSMLFGAGALLLYRYRRQRLAEIGLWTATGCYAGLMVWWILYLRMAEACVSDPAVFAAFVRY
ncbi:MAG: DUF5658 family protein [Planctomycetota bacterium]